MFEEVRNAIGRNATVRNTIVGSMALWERQRINSFINELRETGQKIPEQLADAFEQFTKNLDTDAQAWAQKIEAHRARLLQDRSQLDRGDLGDAGINDGNQTVRDAVSVSKRPRAARLLLNITAALQSKQIIEMGTNVGISSSYIGAGQRTGKVNAPKLVTMESSPYRARIAENMHKSLGLDFTQVVLGDFNETLAPTLNSMETPDLVFIDGNHKYKPTIRYTDMILDAVDGDIVLIYDDIRWSDGMEKAWLEIMADKRFAFAMDLNTMGIAVRCAASEQQYRSSRLYSLAA